MKFPNVWFVFLTITALSAACANAGSSDTSVADGAASASTQNQVGGAGGGQVGNIAPDFAVSTLDGRQITLASLKGRPFLLHFFATW